MATRYVGTVPLTGRGDTGYWQDRYAKQMGFNLPQAGVGTHTLGANRQPLLRIGNTRPKILPPKGPALDQQYEYGPPTFPGGAPEEYAPVSGPGKQYVGDDPELAEQLFRPSAYRAGDAPRAAVGAQPASPVQEDPWAWWENFFAGPAVEESSTGVGYSYNPYFSPAPPAEVSTEDTDAVNRWLERVLAMMLAPQQQQQYPLYGGGGPVFPFPYGGIY